MPKDWLSHLPCVPEHAICEQRSAACTRPRPTALQSFAWGLQEGATSDVDDL